MINAKKFFGLFRVPPQKGLVNRSVKKTKAIKTVYLPSMSSVHFFLIAAAFNAGGFQVRRIAEKHSIDLGLGKRFIEELNESFDADLIQQILAQSREEDFDSSTSAFLIPHWIGGDKACLEPARRVLAVAGVEDVRFIRLSKEDECSAVAELKHSDLRRLLFAVVAGDFLLHLSIFTRAHEIITGLSQELTEKWTEILSETILTGRLWKAEELFSEMAEEFLMMPLDQKEKRKIGIASDVLMGFDIQGKRNLIDEILKSEAEPVLSDLSSSLLEAHSKEAGFDAPYHKKGGLSESSFFALEKSVEFWKSTAKRVLEEADPTGNILRSRSQELWQEEYEKTGSCVAGDVANFRAGDVSKVIFLKTKDETTSGLNGLFPQVQFMALGNSASVDDRKIKDCVQALIA